MAQIMMCDGPDEEVARFVVTNIDEAEVKAFCLSCMADFALAYLQIVAPDRLTPPAPAPRKRKGAVAAAAAAAHAEGGQGESGAETAD